VLERSPDSAGALKFHLPEGNPSFVRWVGLTMRAFAAPVIRDFGRSTNRPVMSRDPEEEKRCCAYSGLQRPSALDNDIAEPSQWRWRRAALGIRRCEIFFSEGGCCYFIITGEVLSCQKKWIIRPAPVGRCRRSLYREEDVQQIGVY